jgi:hypothetical protein
VPLLQRSVAQAGGSGQLAIVGVASEAQSVFNCITAAVTCRQLSSAAPALGDAAAQVCDLLLQLTAALTFGSGRGARFAVQLLYTVIIQVVTCFGF